MQTSRLSCSSFKENEEADNSQKMAQSKDIRSLLVSTPTGMVSSPLHGLNASFQACNSSSTCKFGENGHATTGYTSAWKDEFCVDHCYATKDTNVLLPKETSERPTADRIDSFSVKQKVAALLCAVAVTLGLLFFGVHLYQKMEEQSQSIQIVIKDYQSLRENFDNVSDGHRKLRADYHALRDDHRKLRTDYHALRDDLQKLRTESDQNQTLHAVFKDSVLKDYHSLRENYDSLRNDYQDLYTESDDHILQKKMTVNDAEANNSFSASNDQPQTSPGALLQVLQSNGWSPTIPPQAPRRTKRRARNHRHIQNVVSNYLLQMPKVHLRGLSNVNQRSEYTDPMNRTVLWQISDSFYPRGVTLRFLNGQSDRIMAIEIQEAGYYVVYSQVIVNGSTHRTWRLDCAHQTVELFYHDYMDHYSVETPKRVLLSGFVTQDSLGFYPNSNIPYPRDSSMHVGVFRLQSQSQIRVQIPDVQDCRQTLFATDLHSSNFGLFKIG